MRRRSTPVPVSLLRAGGILLLLTVPGTTAGASAESKPLPRDPAIFEVNFTEDGLSNGTAWTVALDGESINSTATWIAFWEANGTGYSYAITPPPSYAAVPASGVVNVTGRTQNVPISFGPSATAPTIVQFYATPAVATVSAPVELHAETSGGTAPLTFAYTGLPAGCPPTNASTIACSPSAAGTFSIDLVVTDRFGRSATTRLSLLVQANDSGAGGSGARGPTVLGLPAAEGEGLLLGIGLVAVIGSGVALATRRRRIVAEVVAPGEWEFVSYPQMSRRRPIPPAAGGEPPPRTNEPHGPPGDEESGN